MVLRSRLNLFHSCWLMGNGEEHQVQHWSSPLAVCREQPGEREPVRPQAAGPRPGLCCWTAPNQTEPQPSQDPRQHCSLCAARGHVRRTSTFGSLSQLHTRAFLTWRLMGGENRMMSWAYHHNYLLSFIFLLEYILHSWYVQMKQNLWGLSEVSSIKNPKPGGDFQGNPRSSLWEIELKRALFLFLHWKGWLARPFSSSQWEFNPFIASISVFVVKNHVPVSKGLEGCGWESMWQLVNESSYRNDVYLSWHHLAQNILLVTHPGDVCAKLLEVPVHSVSFAAS